MTADGPSPERRPDPIIHGTSGLDVDVVEGHVMVFSFTTLETGTKFGPNLARAIITSNAPSLWRRCFVFDGLLPLLAFRLTRRSA